MATATAAPALLPESVEARHRFADFHKTLTRLLETLTLLFDHSLGSVGEKTGVLELLGKATGFLFQLVTLLREPSLLGGNIDNARQGKSDGLGPHDGLNATGWNIIGEFEIIDTSKAQD